MPLVRFEVKNEYGLGMSELYNKGEENKEEDPKAILDGVAVSGLVGILRQLGDLAEFAAEVFHGLQEQVMMTSARSHKLMARVRNIESELPHVEKAALAQTSHLHFCYTAGSDWHTYIQNRHNHFIYGDLPRFIMDSYEECHEPPRLHLLDKFDSGGPGSCLKRYSDPAYFKNVSAKSDEVNGNRSQRHKVRKRKKKRLGQRNREILHGASLSTASGRMQFTPPNVSETSPAHSVSTMERTLNSDLEGRSPSFDSRTEAGYIECVFHPSSTMQPTEKESMESSPHLNKRPVENLDKAYPYEHIKVADDFPSNSLQEQTAPGFSYVTWDEKIEIVELKDQQCSDDEAQEMLLPTGSSLGMQETVAVNASHVDQRNIVFNVDNTPIPIRNQLDGIESEPDDFVDALNTIESESETDLDCLTKHEVDQCSNLKGSESSDDMHKIIEHESDHHLSNFESHAAVNSSSHEAVSWNVANAVSSESVGHEESPTTVVRSDRDCFLGMEFYGNDSIDGFNSDLSSSGSTILDSKESTIEKVIKSACETQESSAQISSEGVTNEESPPTANRSDQDCSAGMDFHKSDRTDDLFSNAVNSVQSSSGSTVPNPQHRTIERVIHNAHETQQSPIQISNLKPISFWTNGSLLGLQPSKPPDFTVSSVVSQDSEARSRDGTVIPSVQHVTTNNCGTLSTQHELVGGTCPSNISNHLNGCDLNESSLVSSGSEIPSTTDVKAASNESTKKNHEDTSQMSGLGYKLFMNGFHRKVSVVHDYKSEPITFWKSGSFDDKSGNHSMAYRTFPETTLEQFTNSFHVNSPNSSPPLGHMKVSFHPTLGIETSKLKLKYHDESQNREFNSDMFPSFQLVPEPDILLCEIGSDSDDDTFCKPSPCRSDACLSYYSESNSEQWESSESPKTKDQELYDAFGRISSMESVSSPLEFDTTSYGRVHVNPLASPDCENGEPPSHRCPSNELPSLDTMNPSLLQEMKYETVTKDSPASKEPARPPPPPPPPLPPLQWVVSQVHMNVEEDNQVVASEARCHASSAKLIESAFPQVECKAAPIEPQKIPKASVKQQNIIQEIDGFILKSKHSDHKKLNEDRKANQPVNDKEGEDFLHQIRTQSYNLRRTTPVRPNSGLAPAPSANVKVTAILEKANAIRQAVASDDGEDDNWSDT